MIEVKCSSVEESMHIFGMIREIIRDYGFASVGDLYDIIRVTGCYTDNYGWCTLNKCNLVPTKDGFILELPRPIDLTAVITPNQFRKKLGLPKVNEVEGIVTKEIKTTRETILDKAKTCVCGQRADDYGTPEDNFTIIADLWSTYTGHKLTAVDVSMMMSMLKIARIKTGTATEDSFVDLAGYAACGGEISANRKGDK
ncbi:DUF6378 domain-containing protein [[Clostridium] innocuum]|mgnify:CR=1 FL=1|uniref:DUF6378 domain-containing protein n=1 Tax=Clostridium innocuum TaxID=1522 RepID=UPI001E4DA4BC|nr:DUF6378 domain-containing protein [[Clostridium] innocuum]DAU14253.1 MAG TPA: hypothetical protein [Caudoviricetes sp.]MCC2832070.1 DUF6378 domain-containing protein [[Clostridium] innocuum]MCR0246996.1 DUF6378 domain-containing protein [[Clostridium] innocuum]MCR0258358.1 DUF6378 domain-containing protein [[Clostridium] innocuum]MCR0391056.1 DUF6378 domain-containing protein [[Clostridium] innocuum]